MVAWDSGVRCPRGIGLDTARIPDVVVMLRDEWQSLQDGEAGGFEWSPPLLVVEVVSPSTKITTQKPITYFSTSTNDRPSSPTNPIAYFSTSNNDRPATPTNPIAYSPRSNSDRLLSPTEPDRLFPKSISDRLSSQDLASKLVYN